VGWKFLTGWVKLAPCEVSECEWKFINWLVEMSSCCEVNECRWKFINWLIEIMSSCEVSVGGSLSTG
jgi:hypothetical protein